MPTTTLYQVQKLLANWVFATSVEGSFHLAIRVANRITVEEDLPVRVINAKTGERVYSTGQSQDEQDDATVENAREYDTDWPMDAPFADPGGRSALRLATPKNPRILPCPTCGRPNQLTPEDVKRGYQCDQCADTAEGHGDPWEY